MSDTATTSGRVPRILVVDDMPDNLFLMNGLLEDRYEVLQARSGREALECVMSPRPPDMILLDIMMPDMDGYEVLRRVRQHPPTAAIPIVFLTALAGMQDERLGRELGALDYLTKPVDPELVVRRVEAHVQATAREKRIEALAEKLSRHLPPEQWGALFHGAERDAIHFIDRQGTLVHVEPAGELDAGALAAFECEVHGIAEELDGMADPWRFGNALVYFDDAAAALRMAQALQERAGPGQLRMGLHTGDCDIAVFHIEGETRCSVIGDACFVAAQVAAGAEAGSISVSPETYALVRDVLHDPASAALIERFQDSGLGEVWLTPGSRDAAGAAA